MNTDRPYAALIRGEDGSLAVRYFAEAADAVAASSNNPSLEVASPSSTMPLAERGWKRTGSPAELSKALGGRPSAATITRLCAAGKLPCRDDGAGTLPRWRLPIRPIVASVMAVGFRATLARYEAGQLHT